MRAVAVGVLLVACTRSATVAPPVVTAPPSVTVPPAVTTTAAPAAPTTTTAETAPVAVTVPVLSDLPVEVMADAPSSVRDARFELPTREGAWSEIAAVRGDEASPRPVAAQRAASFLVDFDQEPLRAMCTEAAPTAEAVIAMADARITRKSLAVGLVTASTAAAGREGDCTEHAVVTAALLRCHGHPARLAVGMLVVRLAVGRWFAGMHMWAEYYDRGWRVADATFPERHGEVAHLRMDLVRDEGPACQRDMMRALVGTPRMRLRVSARPQ